MAQVINTNIASLTAQRNLNSSQKLSDTALQRLSSGLRINSSKDDAAGLAISTRFDAQIRGSNQAIRNSADAISLAQTAEGGLKSITVALQRMRELSVQASNDTNTAVDRQALQEEVSQLVAEIKSIAENSNFNGRKLLDGSFTNATFQTGSNVGETISFGIAKVGSDTLGNAETAGVSSRTETTAFLSGTNGNAMVAGDLVINGISVAASVGSDDVASSLEGRSSSIAKAAAINRESSLTGVVASVDSNYVQGGTNATNATGTANLSIQINGVEFDLAINTTLTVEQNLAATANALNAESGVTGVRAVAGDYGTQGITLIADDGRNIALMSSDGDALAQSYGLVSVGSTVDNQDIYVGTYTLISTDGTDIDISSDTGNIGNAGFEEGMFSGTNSGVVSDGFTTALTGVLQEVGDLVINGVSIGSTAAEMDTFSSADKANSAISRATAINLLSDATGVTATALGNTVYSGDLEDGTGESDITLNGVTISVNFATGADIDVKLNTIIDAVNDSAGQTGVTAEALDGDSLKLVAEDGRNITISDGNTMLGGGGAALSTSSYTAAVALEGAGGIEISTLTNEIQNWGFRVGSFGGGEAGTKLDDIDITTVQGANDAITAVDNALASVASISATLGAVQNRFDSVISNLQLRAENLSAANSQITDADFAAETARLTKSQVLQQAGISVLAQANARPQQVLSLLG